MKAEEIILRINSITDIGNGAIKNSSHNSTPSGPWAGFRSASLSLIKNLYGVKHPYFTDFDKYTQYSHISSVQAGISILGSIKSELENGWLISYKKLISAELFSDFLEMGKYLLDQKFKDAAAVIIGSVLEEHLRFLCNSHSIEITYRSVDNVKPKKADVLNSDLVKAEIYGVLDQKNVTAWLDLRNRAAHGKYDEYNIDQVNLMYQGVLLFITSTS